MIRRALAVFAAAAILPTVAHAQEPAGNASGRPLDFGVAAGITLPVGDAGDFYDWGFHLSGLVAGKPRMSPVGFRGELMWHRLTGASASGSAGTVDVPDANVVAGIANAELGIGSTGWKPYVIGGLGMYRTSAGGSSSTDFGFNVGLGFRRSLAGFDAFGELRFHSVQTEGTSTNLVPISVGFRF